MAAGVKIGLFKPLGEASFSEPCDLELVQASYRVLNLNIPFQKPSFIQWWTILDQTCQGVKFLMDKNKIDVHHGVGSFVDKNTVKITRDANKHRESHKKNR